MKRNIILLFFALSLTGCISTSHIMKDPSQYEEINALGRKYSATITVQGDSATEEYAGDYVTVGSDSARWIKPRTGIRQAVATTQLRRIRFLRRGAGALLGAAEGAAPGAVLGILSFVFAAPKTGETGLLQLLLVVFGALCAIGGAVIGAVAGAIAGSKTDFLF